MARNYNQDYFKVGGSNVEDRDQANMNRSKLAHQAAVLHHAQQQGKFPVKKAKAGTRAASAPSGKVASPRQDEERSQTTFERSTAPAPRKPSRAVAEVHAIQQEKPKHGKKRRSAKKRHAVGVLNEMRANPELSPHEASESLRTSDRPIAEVIDVRKNRTAREVPESAMPNAAPREDSGGLFGFAKRSYDTGQKMFRFARDFVTAPLTIARIIRGLRERNVAP
jgi:hypothetical protein